MTRERMVRQVELDALHGVVAKINRALTDADAEPSVVVVTAVGAFVHQFYNGIENVLKRIALHYGSALPEGGRYHADLLALFKPGTEEPMPITLDDDLFDDLNSFLQFRHVFRVSYSFQLDWSRLSAGAALARTVLDRFEREVRAALDLPARE